MPRSKIDFRHLVIEALLIVFTVLLALALSEWRNSFKEQKTREVVINNIIKEIKANKEDLESKVGYHEKMSEKFGRYLNSDSLWSTLKYESGIEAALQILENGIRNPLLQSGAWRSAELSGVVNSFDFEVIYVLSSVYRVQEEGPNNSWKQLAAIMGDPASYQKENARNIAIMLQLGFRELYSQEKSLIITYENALRQLEGKN